MRLSLKKKEKASSIAPSADSEKTDTLPLKRTGMGNTHTKTSRPIPETKHSSHQHSTSGSQSYQSKNPPSTAFIPTLTTWTDFLQHLNNLARSHETQVTLFDSQRKQLEEDLATTQKNVALLETQLHDSSRDRDDPHFKLQQTLTEMSLKQKEFATTENLLQTKVQTLDTALEAAKDEIARGFVDGFSVALEQFRALYPDLNQSEFDPFKIVVNGKIV